MPKRGDDDNTGDVAMLAVSSLPSQMPGSMHSAAESWDDERLVAALLLGDRKAAGVLYDHLRPAIDAALRRLLHQRGHDFEDHVQTTFERILRALAEGRFEGRSSLKTWACAIASHVALDAIRRMQRERPRSQLLPEQDLLPSGEQSDRKIESVAELRRVQGILAGMKPQLSEALILHDVLGYQLSEIGEIADTSPSATQSRLHRARKEFRRRAESSINRRRS